MLSPEFKSVWVDSVDQYQRIVEFLDQIQPNLVSRVRLYRRDEPIFDEFGIEPEIAKALKSKVWLKSGGYIVINQTEALVAIDVNTGKYVGKKNLEETVFRTNLEAAKEIVRQIRLRDLGGIIVLDFIDMEEPENRARLFEALENEIKKDRSKTKILQISEFGLIEMTRKRVRQSLERSLTQACPYCGGSGRIKSNTTIALEIWRELMKLRDFHEGQDVIVRVNPIVYATLHAGDPIFEEIERNLGIHLVFKPDESLHQDFRIRPDRDDAQARAPESGTLADAGLSVLRRYSGRIKSNTTIAFEIRRELMKLALSSRRSGCDRPP